MLRKKNGFYCLLLALTALTVSISESKAQSQYSKGPILKDQHAVISGIPEGSFRGKFVGARNGRVHLISNRLAGCDSCFLATLFVHHNGFLSQSSDEVRVYKAVPRDLNVSWVSTNIVAPVHYTLTPIEVDTDGELVQSSQPSLILQIMKKQGTDDVEFSTVQANSVNMDAFGSAMRFNGNLSRNEIDDVEAGTIREEFSCQKTGAISVVTESSEDGSRSATVTDFKTNGLFQVEEKAPNVFTYQRDNALATGDVVSDYPNKLIIFIKRGSKERALMIDPKNSKNVKELIIKK